MNRFKPITVLLMLLMLWACDTNNTDKPSVKTPLQVEVKAPLGMEGELKELKGIITGSDGQEVELNWKHGVAVCELPEGNYTIELTAQFRFTDHHQMVRDEALHLVDNIALEGKEKVIKVLQFSSFQTSGTFLIEEIFFAGTTTKEGNQYDDDKYIIITNNSEQTLYADGLTLLVSHFTADEKKHNLQPDVLPDKFPVKVAYQIKGKGTDYPVKAGESMILCQSAIDHTEFNPQSFSLLDADFEWLSEQAATVGEFPNNPATPNMTLVYSNDGNGVWSMGNNGNETYAIARLSDEFISHIGDYKYDYVEDIIVDGVNYGSFPGETAVAIPNELILDAVNLCPKNNWQWLPISSSQDNGYAFVAEESHSSKRYMQSVVRKSEMKGNKKVLIDTNNSSEDFEISNPATLLNN
ncbi:DUF4876 domain-containing protein [Porphyromonadaceae bacterium W3.11]|nr:DUF4876 domain-containing protein [Porphyromonadaceae bacterium W3.11]